MIWKGQMIQDKKIHTQKILWVINWRIHVVSASNIPKILQQKDESRWQLVSRHSKLKPSFMSFKLVTIVFIEI